MRSNTQSVSPSFPHDATPEIVEQEQQALGLGPGRVHRGGTVPWHKRLVLTRAPSPAAHHILLVLGSFVSDSATDAWPSIAWLADKSGRSPRVVQRCIRELRDAGLVAVRLSSGGTSRYRLIPTTPASPTHDASGAPPTTPASSPPRRPRHPEVLSEVTSTSTAAALLPVPVQEGVDEKPQAETKQPVPERVRVDRHTCGCGHTWPESFGVTCFKCQRKVGSSHPAGYAAPVPGKYDGLYDPPAENSAPTVKTPNETGGQKTRTAENSAPAPHGARAGGLLAEYAERLRSARSDPPALDPDPNAYAHGYSRVGGVWMKV